MIDTIIRAGASLGGAVLGILIFACAERAGWLLIPAFVLLWAGMAVAKAAFARRPFAARVAIELWPLATTIVVAGVTLLALKATMQFGESFIAARLGLSVETAKAVAATLVAAITGFLGVVAGKAAETGEGAFSVSGTFRGAIQKAYPVRFPGAANVDAAPYRAAFKADIPGIGAVGWDFSARTTRTRLFAVP